jgi:2',3'-cyclic-nucleotide 2'-phosphodiesterase/3'-nucleotidase
LSTAISRRAFLGATASLAGAAFGGPEALSQGAAPRVHLRLLETSDLHMFVMDWDYYRAKTDATVGLARTATLIRAARSENPNTLLFDNGDFLQGNPLADYVAAQPAPSASKPHPLVTTMAGLGYDAAGLGNHEFNYGLDFLEASLQGAPFPFLCANVVRAGGGAFLPPTAILKRAFKDEAGVEHDLRIGVISFVPPQIMTWDKSRLQGKIEASDIVVAARNLIPDLRKTCDVVVALCHAGIKTGPWAEGEENASFHLAAVPGIDVIMTGHSHRVFPGKDFASLPGVDAVGGRLDGVDAVGGRLDGVPAVMPGFWGSHLGVVDLALTRKGERWTVENAQVEARPIYRRAQDKVEELAQPDALVTTSIAAAHRGALSWVEQPVGAIDGQIHSYFVWAGHDPATALVNAAQIWYARPLLATAGFGDLPLLSTASPFRVGYTPDSFIDIPAGQVPLRAIADLYIYSSNTVTVVKVTGAQILEWLDYAARAFNTIDPSKEGAQALINKSLPSYNFDTIAGLTYRIDVTKPTRGGGVGAPGSGRIVDVRFEGEPIALDREFAVVTNNYRADGGGKFPAMANAQTILRMPDTNRDAIARYFKASPTVEAPKIFPWAFAKTGKATAVYFDTGRAAAPLLPGFPGLSPMGDGEPGYVRVAMTLS